MKTTLKIIVGLPSTIVERKVMLWCLTPDPMCNNSYLALVVYLLFWLADLILVTDNKHRPGMVECFIYHG